jgi:hypothetical protein
MARYLRDSLNTIVYHLAVMKPECKIHNVKKDRQYFIPDALEQTIKGKFTHASTILKPSKIN